MKINFFIVVIDLMKNKNIQRKTKIGGASTTYFIKFQKRQQNN